MGMIKCPWCDEKPAGKNIEGFCSIKCEKEFKAWCDTGMTYHTEEVKKR
jgi:hypothetical protein